MLKGFAVPRSPLGQASLDPPPPWHYSSDVVGVEYWADPAATAAILPEGLSPDPASNGHAMWMFLDWQFTAQNDEYLDPMRYQYREAFLLIDAVWRDMPLVYCPYIWVDNDAALARGWIQGFPKKLGQVFQTRTFAARSRAAAPVQPGGKFAASLSAGGHRLADVRVTLREKIEDPSKMFNRPTALMRYFPRLEAGKQDKPAVHELCLSLTDDLQMVDLWVGDGQLEIPRVQGEELHALAPVRVGSGFRFGLAYTVSDLRVLESFTA